MAPRVIFWSSDCGHSGQIETASECLGPLVRESRLNHDQNFPDCDMVDIDRVETEAERRSRTSLRPAFKQLGERFC